MLYYILMIILGLILLILGANLLVRGSSNIAKKFHIPEILVGLTIVAIGTSAPELIITITSAQNSMSDLIIGNAVGSNLCNILLILGLMSVVSPITIDKDTRKFHIPVALLSTLIVLLMGLGILGNNTAFINRNEGIFLVLLFVIYFAYPIIKEFEDIVISIKNNTNNTELKKINPFLCIIFIVLGVILLKYGGDLVVDYSTVIAEVLNISERVIGLTIVAIGTALPELVTSIVSIIKKDTDLAVGNLLGSCVLNLLLILGIGAILTPLEFTPDFIQNLILLCFCTFLLYIFNYIGKKNTITRTKGFILLIIYSIYFFKLFI